MHSLSSLMPKFKPPKIIKTEQWQANALDCIAKLVDGQKYKSSIFKCYKQDPRTAQLSLLDCEELGKLHSLYFLKVFNSIRSKV